MSAPVLTGLLTACGADHGGDVCAAVVFAEKVLPRARVVGVVAAVALVVIGVAVMGRPSLLPTVA